MPITLPSDAYMGRVWYRTHVKLGALPEGKRIKLWVGATDGSVQIFVNGKPVSFVDANGERVEAATGHCNPFSFDVTDAVAANSVNPIAILATRTFINELGTGVLLAPITLYAE